MKLPFVTRGRFEDSERRLRESEAERKMLMDKLFAQGVSPTPVPRVETAQSAQPATETKQSNLVPFTTPIDAQIARFDKAHAGGKIPSSSFRVKI